MSLELSPEKSQEKNRTQTAGKAKRNLVMQKLYYNNGKLNTAILPPFPDCKKAESSLRLEIAFSLSFSHLMRES